MLRTLRIASLIFSVAAISATAQTIPAHDALKHLGERGTVCGTVAGKHVATHSQGMPTFIDFDKPFPNQAFTVVVWARDKAAVETVPASGHLCVTGQIEQYRGGAEIVLHNTASWYVPKPSSAAPSSLSNDRHYTNSNGQQVHSPAYSSGGVPAGATAVCRDGTYSFSQHRSGTCSHHGGVAKWL